jgi:hypothetical protein
MDNIKPFMNRLGSHIVKMHLQNGEPLTNLVAKTASERNFTDKLTQALTTETNKAYVNLTGNHEFDMASSDGVYNELYGNPNEGLTKVAYAYPEYDSTLAVEEPLSKAASVELTPNVNDKPTDFRHVFRELSRKSAYSAKEKRAHHYLSAQDEYDKISNNVNVLKMLGYSEQEVHDKLLSRGVTSKEASHVMGIWKKSTKTASYGSNRAQYNTEGYFQGVVESSKKLASHLDSFIEADAEFNRATKAQEVTYKQGRILI